MHEAKTSGRTLHQITKRKNLEPHEVQGIEAIHYTKLQQAAKKLLLVGKDEVGSSNLPSSSKPLKLRFQGFFVV